MPINLQGSGNIAEGWGPPPQLHAPELGSLVHAILGNKLARDKMTQESIADTIKNIQEQRQSGAYLDAMQKAGVLPEGDYGALGAKGASLLAQEIIRKKEADARAAHLGALTAHVGSGRGRGGGGGGGSGSAEPQTVWKDGIEWRPGPGGRWIPMKPAAGTKADVPKLSPTEKGWAAPEIPGVSVDVNAPDEPAKFLPPDTSPMPGPPSVPPLLQRPPDASATPPPADTATGHAQGYGTDATSMSADDVRAAYRAGKMTVEEAKARLKAMGFSD